MVHGEDGPDLGPALEAEARDHPLIPGRDMDDEPLEMEEPSPPRENPWRPITEAPKDRIIEGRFAMDQTEGRPVRWRSTRRRAGPALWVTAGVWHAAETKGAVELRPIEWREWQPAGLHFPEAPEAA